MDKLKELMRGQLEQQTNGLTRTQMKRQLLDQLAAGHDFEVPEGMVNAEFEKLSGLSKAEIEGKRSWTEFVVPDDLDPLNEFAEMPIPSAEGAPERPKGSRCIDMPPAIGLGK